MILDNKDLPDTSLHLEAKVGIPLPKLLISLPISILYSQHKGKEVPFVFFCLSPYLLLCLLTHPTENISSAGAQLLQSGQRFNPFLFYSRLYIHLSWYAVPHIIAVFFPSHLSFTPKQFPAISARFSLYFSQSYF